jgi:arabinogalactan oligomer/maltooligosaccharide transport system permease protein
MGIITFYPLLYQTWMSFTDYTLENLPPRGEAPAFVGLDNYVRVLTTNLNLPNYDFVRILVFNLFWAFSNVIIHVILGVLIAVLLNTEGLWLRKFWRALYIIPVVIPPIIVATIWANMFDRDSGAVNLALQAVGALLRIPPESFQIDWLHQVENPLPGIDLLPLAYFSLLIANTWLGWPLNSVVATGALQSIPKEMYEAAEMDGASSWQRFRNITIPFLRPACALRDLRVRDHVQPVLPLVLHVRRWSIRTHGDHGDPGLPPRHRAAALRRRGGLRGDHVLHPARPDAADQPVRQGDRELRGLREGVR